MFQQYTHKERGVSAVEVVIGVSIAALVITFTAHTLARFVNTGRTMAEKTEALYLAEEGLELLRFIHDDDWSDISSLSTNGTHYIAVGTSGIGVTTTPEIIDGFARSFTVKNVYRNSSSDDIIASTTPGAVADTDAKYVTVSVSFGSPTTTISLTSILANLNP